MRGVCCGVGTMDEECALGLLVVIILSLVFPVQEHGLVRDGPLKHFLLSRKGGQLELLRSQRSGSKGGGMDSFFCFCDYLLVSLLLKLPGKEVKLLCTFAAVARTLLVGTLAQGLDLCVRHPQAQGLLFPPARFGVLSLLGLFFVVEKLVAVLLLTLELVLLLDKQGQADLVVDCGRVVGLLLLAVALFELFSLFDQAGFVVVEKLDLDGDGAGDDSERRVY